VRSQERAQVQLQNGTGSGSELVCTSRAFHQRLYFVREVTSPISADCDGHQVSDRIWPQIDPMPRGARLKLRQTQTEVHEQQTMRTPVADL